MNNNSSYSKNLEKCNSSYCEVRESPIHGLGVYAKKDIPKGTYIIKYLGEKITKEESEKRGWDQIEISKKTGQASVYIFYLDDEWDIDGNIPNNAAKLINHSCNPNAESFIENDSIWIGAIRDIKKDEEILFNYGFDLESYKDHKCKCGYEKCIGYILGEEYWSKINTKY